MFFIINNAEGCWRICVCQQKAKECLWFFPLDNSSIVMVLLGAILRKLFQWKNSSAPFMRLPTTTGSN